MATVHVVHNYNSTATVFYHVLYLLQFMRNVSLLLSDVRSLIYYQRT